MKQDRIHELYSEQEGQAVVADNNYIPLDNAEAYTSSGASGKVVVAGSSSVSPVMEKLKEAYADANSGVEIEIQTSDSTTGMQNAIDGVCDIGIGLQRAEGFRTGSRSYPYSHCPGRYCCYCQQQQSYR